MLRKKKTVWGIKTEKTFAHIYKAFPLQKPNKKLSVTKQSLQFGDCEGKLNEVNLAL